MPLPPPCGAEYCGTGGAWGGMWGKKQETEVRTGRRDKVGEGKKGKTGDSGRMKNWKQRGGGVEGRNETRGTTIDAV